MRCRVFTEPQEGATYDDQLAFATLAEGRGFDAYRVGRCWVTVGFVNPPSRLRSRGTPAAGPGCDPIEGGCA